VEVLLPLARVAEEEEEAFKDERVPRVTRTTHNEENNSVGCGLRAVVLLHFRLLQPTYRKAVVGNTLVLVVNNDAAKARALRAPWLHASRA
jgi:hypothetical protein